MNLIGTWYIIFMSLSTMDCCKKVTFSNSSLRSNCINIHFTRIDSYSLTEHYLDYHACYTNNYTLLLNNNNTMNIYDLNDTNRVIIKIEDQILLLTRNLSYTLYPVSQQNCHPC